MSDRRTKRTSEAAIFGSRGPLHESHRAAALLAFLLACAGTALAQTSAPAASDSLDIYRMQQDVFRRAAERVAPSVVTIETIGGTQPTGAPPGMQPRSGPPEGPPGGPERPGRAPRTPRPDFIIADGPTTGLVWSADGLILTSAFNFVRDPSVITVILPDGRRFVGELLARDEVRRLAMLKIEAHDLPVPTWVRDRQEIQVGQWALALGRGLGGEATAISVGIISGLNRKGGVSIQTDAKLSPVNYGGPLIDIEGRVIGLCVPMGLSNAAMAGVEWYDSGIGFAVPFWQVDKSAEALAVGHNLRRGLLGVQIDPRAKGGAHIFNIADPSPAARAGLEVGDVILALEGKPVGEYADLQRLMSARVAGERVTLRVRRDKEELNVPVVLGVPEDMGPMREPPPQSGPAATRPPESGPGND